MVLAVVGDSNVGCVREDVEIVLFAVTRAARDTHPMVRSAAAVSVREAVNRFLLASFSSNDEDVDVSGFLEPLHVLLGDVEPSVRADAAISMREILLQDTRSYMPSFNALIGCIESTANVTVKKQCMITLSSFFEGKKKDAVGKFSMPELRASDFYGRFMAATRNVLGMRRNHAVKVAALVTATSLLRQMPDVVNDIAFVQSAVLGLYEVHRHHDDLYAVSLAICFRNLIEAQKGDDVASDFMATTFQCIVSFLENGELRSPDATNTFALDVMGNVFRVCGVKAKAFAQPCLTLAMSAMACPQALETIPLILAAVAWDPETSRRVLSVLTDRMESETVVVCLIGQIKACAEIVTHTTTNFIHKPSLSHLCLATHRLIKENKARRISVQAEGYEGDESEEDL